MQRPNNKNNLRPQWFGRGMNGARRLLLDPDASLNTLRASLDEAEDKYEHAMVSITQLRSEKCNLEYQIDHLKDVNEEMEENLLLIKTENKINSENLKILQRKLEECTKIIHCREELLQKHWIVPEDTVSCDVTQGTMTGVISTAQLTGDERKGENKTHKDQLESKDRNDLQEDLQTAINRMEEMGIKQSHLLKRLQRLTCDNQ